MYHIHSFKLSFNTTKLAYVAAELGIDYDYTELDFTKSEHKSAEHLARHPLGKIPTLSHDGRVLFESGAICRYLASEAKSDLYPLNDNFQRALVDQWMDFFSIHLGRWLATLLFERVFKAHFGRGEADPKVDAEALGFVEIQMAALNKHLGNNAYLVGDKLSIADLFGFAYLETTKMTQVSLDPYPHVKAWFEKIEARPAITKGKQKLGLA